MTHISENGNTKTDVSLLKFWEQEVLPRLTAELVYDHPSHRFQRSAQKWRGGSPFRQSKSGTSFAVWPDTLRFYDAGCEFAGDPIAYTHSIKVGRWEHPKGIDWVEALREIADRVGLTLPERERSPREIEVASKWEMRRGILAAVYARCRDWLWEEEGTSALNHLIAERGIPREAIAELGLGYYHSKDEVAAALKQQNYDLEIAEQVGVLTPKWEGYVTFPWHTPDRQPLTVYGHCPTKPLPLKKDRRGWKGERDAAYRAWGKLPEAQKLEQPWTEPTVPKKYACWNPKDGEGAWLATKESPLYFDRARASGHKEVVVVEGVTDAAIAQALGDTRVVACVAASLSGEQVQSLRRSGIERVVICLDPDSAGDKGIESCIKSLMLAGIAPYVAPRLPVGEDGDGDPDKFITRNGIDAWRSHTDSNNAQHGLRWKARQITGSTDKTDAGKQAALEEAAKWATAIKDAEALDIFFWPAIGETLGSSPPPWLVQFGKELGSKPRTPGPIAGDNSKRSDSPTKMPLEEAADAARQILANGQDEIEIEIALEQLRLQTGKGEYWWQNNFIKPLKRDMDAERFKLELLGLLQMADPVERIRQIALLAPRYSMSAGSVKEAMSEIKQRTIAPETEVLDFGELLATSSEAIDWLVPGLLPAGETVLLCALPKVGKSKLAVDLAFCAATGESKFLGQEVKRGKVLLVAPDASKQSLKHELTKRGFRLQDSRSLHVIPRWTIDQLAVLEAELEDFRPDLVVIDSLKRITAGKEVSENSAEFADNIIALNDLLARYRAAGILIHHANKGADAVGVEKARGSTAIVASCWGMWALERIPKQDPNNKKKLIVDPKCPKRIFTATGRDSEGATLNIEFNAENNSWDFLTEAGVDEAESVRRQSYKERIANVLRANQKELPGPELMELLGVTTREQKNAIYATLGRMVNERLISSSPAPNDKRYTLYSLPNFTPTGTTVTETADRKISLPPPPPPDTVSVVGSSSESITQQALENNQHCNQHTTNTQQGADNSQIAESLTATGIDSTTNSFQVSGGGGGIRCSPDSETVTPASAQLAQSHPLAHPANPAGASELQNPPAAKCEPEPNATNAEGTKKDGAANPSPVDCEPDSIAPNANPTANDLPQHPSPADLETDPIAPYAGVVPKDGVQNPPSVECSTSSNAPFANQTADDLPQNPPPTRTESDSIAPSGNPKDSDASAALEPELNEDELFLIGCIRLLVAETGSTDASEAALDLLPVLSETCDSGAADREKIWQALTGEERDALKALLSTKPTANSPATPEPHSPISPSDAQQIREIALIWWDELLSQSLNAQMAGHIRKYGLPTLVDWLAAQSNALVRERIGRLLERFS
jgi:DNA primase